MPWFIYAGTGWRNSIKTVINLIDNDGEETFISLQQIILMEFDNKLLYNNEPDEEIEEDDSLKKRFSGRIILGKIV